MRKHSVLVKKWLLIYHNLMYCEMNPGPQGITHTSHQVWSAPMSSLPYKKKKPLQSYKQPDIS